MSEIIHSISSFLGSILFFDISFGYLNGVSVPFLVVWLFVAAIFFTIKMNFVNLRFFKHSLQIILGKYSSSKNKGLISPFQSLCTALSATVGLGNIAGVAVAIMVGGRRCYFLDDCCWVFEYVFKI